MFETRQAREHSVRKYRPWTAEELALVREVGARGLSNAKAEEIGKAIGRTMGAVQTRAQQMREDDGAPVYDPTSYVDDGRFAAAMMAAVRAGLEHPPMIGVDTRPGTRNPKRLLLSSDGRLRTRSVLA